METTDYWREFDETYEVVRGLIAEDNPKLKPRDVTRYSRLTDDLGVDSLHRINLALDLEDRYGIKLMNGCVDFIANARIRDIVTMVLKKRGIEFTGV